MQLYYYFELTRDECLRDDRCGPMLRAYEANPDTAHIVGLMHPPDSMEPVTTWDTLTRGDCLQIEACSDAFNNAYRRADIFPEVILGSPHEMRTTAEVLADEQARAAAYAAEQAKYEGWDGMQLYWSEIWADNHEQIITYTITGLVILTAFFAWYYLWHQPREKARKEREEEQSRTHGSAKWLNEKQAIKHNIIGDNSSGLYLGEAIIDENEKKRVTLRYPGKAHMITFAPTGSGKGIGAIIPNLLEYPGSVLCIDPKGENAAVTARFRRETLKQDVYLLDPFQVITDDPASFNPIDWLDPDSENFNADCKMLADALVVTGIISDHWDRQATDLIAGLIMFIAAHETPENTNLLRLYDLLSSSSEQMIKIIKAMQGSSMASIAKAGNRMERLSANGPKEFSSIISSAQSHLHFLDTPQMERVLSSTTFDPMKLKSGGMTVYLILPPDKLKSMSPWLRLMVTLSIASFSRDRTVPEHQTLFLLDEFAALGTLQAVKAAMGLMRGYGVKMWPILQDLSQLRGLYHDMWETFIANAGVCQVFGTNDPTTAEYFSRKIGVSTVMDEIEDENGRLKRQKVRRPLMFPDEIMRMESGQIIMVQNLDAVEIGKPPYWKIERLEGTFDDNPYYD